MSDSYRLPPARAILDMHAELLAEHGGATGLRDPGALQACLARPLQPAATAEAETDLFTFAAALCTGICRIDHPFVDGNKRAALAALGMTLILNGAYLDVSEREAAYRIIRLASGRMAEAAFVTWLRQNSLTEPP